MSRIEHLLAEMTRREKLGQLNMVASGYVVTGPSLGGEAAEAIEIPLVGCLSKMNHRDTEKLRKRPRLEGGALNRRP